ncbi:MAG: HNH endonuclease signature motif containing protein [Arachnia sp.]
MFPGCGVSEPECHAHHVVPWWQGGTSDLENLVLLCPHHHGIVEPTRLHGDKATTPWEVVFDPLTRKPTVRHRSFSTSHDDVRSSGHASSPPESAGRDMPGPPGALSTPGTAGSTATRTASCAPETPAGSAALST